MHSLKERCIQLRKKGHTLTEIIKITGAPKTTVYGYISSIHLPQEKIRSIQKLNRERAISLALGRKGKSLREFQTFDHWGADTVFILAHFIFDGEISRSSCIYNNRNTVLIDEMARRMKCIYSYEPSRYKNALTGVSRISYHNVALSAYMRGKSEELLKSIPRLPVGLKQEFVKAFFDDEGCMDYRPERNLRRVRGYQKDKQILNLIHGLLEEVGIKSVVVQPNEVVISGKENLENFKKKIGFSPGVRTNGKRSNSLWKRSLEKRYLLDLAIKSFKS